MARLEYCPVCDELQEKGHTCWKVPKIDRPANRKVAKSRDSKSKGGGAKENQ